jgi:hypothetical protein
MFDDRMGDSSCFVAIPEDEDEDAITLCGNTQDEARAFAKRTGIELIDD